MKYLGTTNTKLYVTTNLLKSESDYIVNETYDDDDYEYEEEDDDGDDYIPGGSSRSNSSKRARVSSSTSSSSSSSSRSVTFRKGEWVTAEENGTSYPAKVMKVVEEEPKYKIHFSGF